jgi:Rps23 Pro-64 3,4-dihydroxylase Tpa1-like proline 4-hydroxylase
MTTTSQFQKARNEVTRIDRFEELSPTALAALRSFFRRLGAPHVLDEVVLPTLQEGDAQLFAAVRDRPWPPWGVGARHISAVCLVQAVSDESYAISPIWATDEDLTNVGLQSALYKEVLEGIGTSPKAEVNYLVADGSTLADHVLTLLGFRRYEDVFLTEGSRYFTYRIPVAQLLENLQLAKIETPDLLAGALTAEAIQRNALLHSTIYLGSRAEWTGTSIFSEIINLVRGGHSGKPGGVPSGSGRFGWVVNPADVVVNLENFLGADASKQLLEHALKQQKKFVSSTIVPRDAKRAVVDERLRRSRTLDDLGKFEKLVAEKLKEVLAPVLGRLKQPAFPMGRIEMQITASGDGDYFRLHRDTDKSDTRELAFVYHFHREPRRFSGGELRLFANEEIDGKPRPTDRSQILSARQDQIIFFPAHFEHELLPVRVPSKEFGDSRFTVNGWIHRK